MWSDQFEFMAVLMVFNLWIGPSFVFMSWKLIFDSHFPVSTLGLDLFSGAYRNKLLFIWWPVNENKSVLWVHQITYLFA